MDKTGSDTVTYGGHRQRLRQRFLNSGPQGFHDYEIVDLILTLAIPRSDVKQPAKELIARFRNLRGILDAPLDALSKVKGIGSVTPVALKIVREVAALYLQQNAEMREPLINAVALADLWRMRIGAADREVFEIAFLDLSRRLLPDGVERLEEGTVDRATVYPRNVVEAALRRGAAAIAIAHNHPNGDPTLSEQDKTLTRAVQMACDVVSIRVLDHLIVSRDDFYSFMTGGLL